MLSLGMFPSSLWGCGNYSLELLEVLAVFEAFQVFDALAMLQVLVCLLPQSQALCSLGRPSQRVAQASQAKGTYFVSALVARCHPPKVLQMK